MLDCARNRRGGAGEMGGGTAEEHDMCSLPCEEARGSAADTSSSARYNSDAIFECIHTKNYSTLLHSVTVRFLVSARMAPHLRAILALMRMSIHHLMAT